MLVGDYTDPLLRSAAAEIVKIAVVQTRGYRSKLQQRTALAAVLDARLLKLAAQFNF